MGLTHRQNIDRILRQGDPIRLQDMDRVSLQNRIDKKYVMHISQLPDLLECIMPAYFVLDIADTRVFTYRTTYFDTDNLQFYKDHHNGLTNRIKVRCRQYVESDNTFFEIKRKYQGYRTDKYRKSISAMLEDLTEDEYREVRARYAKHKVNQLHITLHNFFSRVTLVSKALTERATIDFQLSFQKEDQEAIVDDIVIVEVKQGKYDDRSAIVQALKRAHIPQQSISKYAYGIVLLERNVKYNAFKRILNRVAKIQSANGVIRQHF